MIFVCTSHQTTIIPLLPAIRTFHSPFKQNTLPCIQYMTQLIAPLLLLLLALTPSLSMQVGTPNILQAQNIQDRHLLNHCGIAPPVGQLRTLGDLPALLQPSPVNSGGEGVSVSFLPPGMPTLPPSFGPTLPPSTTYGGNRRSTSFPSYSPLFPRTMVNEIPTDLPNGLPNNFGVLGNGAGLNTTGIDMNSVYGSRSGYGNGQGLGAMNPLGGVDDRSSVLNTPSLTGTTFTPQVPQIPLEPLTLGASESISGPMGTNSLLQNKNLEKIEKDAIISSLGEQITYLPPPPVPQDVPIPETPPKTIVSIIATPPVPPPPSVIIVPYLPPPPLIVPRSSLQPGESLNRGDYLEAPNSLYYAVLENDGNFAVYKTRNFVAANRLWQSNSGGKGAPGPRQLTLFNDGKLAVHGNNVVYFQIKGKSESPSLKMQSDGNLVLYSGTKFIWASNTCGK